MFIKWQLSTVGGLPAWQVVFHSSLLLRIHNGFCVDAMSAVRIFAQSQYENTILSYSENTMDGRAILTGL
jgi:hypothetical protein